VKRNLLILTLILGLVPFLTSAQHYWTLQECLKYADEHSVDVLKGQNVLENAELAELQSTLAFLPSVNLNGGYYWNFGLTIDPITNTRQPGSRQTLSTTASGNWTLLSGGRNLYQLQQARMNSVAALYQLEDIKNNVYLNVASAYLQVLVNMQLEEVAVAQLATSEKSLDRAQILFENGALSKDNYLQAVSQLKNDEGNVQSATNAVILSRLQLFQLLQMEEGFEDFQVAVPQIDLDALKIAGYGRVDVKESAVQNQPSVKAADANEKSAQMGVKLAQTGRIPSLSFSAQLNSNYVQGLPYFTEYQSLTTYSLWDNPVTGDIDLVPQVVNIPDPASQTTYTLQQQLGDNWNQFVGVGLQIPLFNQGQVHASVQRAKIAADNAALDLKQSELRVRQTIERAYLDATSSLALYRAAEASAEASELALQNAELNFEQGMVNSFDYGLTRNQYLSAKSRAIQSKFDYLFKVKVLEFYLFNQITF
jgi:outer membrane protein